MGSQVDFFDFLGSSLITPGLGIETAMESPLLRAGVAAVQQALGAAPNNQKEEQEPSPNKSESGETTVKTEVKTDITPVVLVCMLYILFCFDFVLHVLYILFHPQV